MNAEWQEALAPLGTDHHKEFLEVAPWLVVLFEQRYELRPDGSTRKNYYVKESTGIAAGLFLAAVHEMGLATLPHTPSPMAFLRTVLDRPENERPFVMFPVGHPLRGALVPDLARKALAEVLVVVVRCRRPPREPRSERWQLPHSQPQQGKQDDRSGCRQDGGHPGIAVSQRPQQ